MKWLEITLDTVHERLDILTAKLEELGVSGLITEDETDTQNFLENNKKYWDYVDEDFITSIKGISRIKFYFEDSEDGNEEFSRIKAALPNENPQDVGTSSPFLDKYQM